MKRLIHLSAGGEQGTAFPQQQLEVVGVDAGLLTAFPLLSQGSRLPTSCPRG